jgi:hypothetical protein
LHKGTIDVVRHVAFVCNNIRPVCPYTQRSFHTIIRSLMHFAERGLPARRSLSTFSCGRWMMRRFQKGIFFPLCTAWRRHTFTVNAVDSSIQIMVSSTITTVEMSVICVQKRNHFDGQAHTHIQISKSSTSYFFPSHPFTR